MKTILIVEDDPATQEAYKEKLTRDGYTLLVASTVDEARTQLFGSIPIDGIILDIMLPGGKNGFDMLEELKANPKWKTIPVLMLTNLNREDTAAHTLGVADYLVKANTSIEQIAATVKRLVG